MPSNLISSLLGMNQIAGQAPNPLEEEETPGIQGNDIDVTADPFVFENTGDVAKRDIALQSGREASDHRGMFKTKGTLRDILGIVGDAFLVQSGNKAVYAPKREQEKMSDAMAGFTDNPMAALERVAGVDPEAAQSMHDQFLLNQHRGAQRDLATQQEQRMGQGQKADFIKQSRDQAGRLISAAMASGDPQLIQSVMGRIKGMAEDLNLSLDELGLSENMSPQELAVYGQAGMTPYQQQRVPQMDRGLDLRERSVGVSASRASESARANRVRESQAAANESGRNSRASQAEEGRNRRSTSKDRGSGPRQLRGTEDKKTSSKRFY